jgi:glycerophosphoryl diester phosphodiesterase
MNRETALVSAFLCVLWGDYLAAAENPDPSSAAANVKQIIAHRGARAERPENTLASR